MTKTRELNTQFMLRMPNGLREKIKIEAARNRRPMNSEILVVLERSFGSEVADGEQA